MSGKFWSQNKEWRNYAEIRAETTAHCSKIRDLRQKRNKLSLKSYLKHKLDILGSNENNFLNNIRQSSWSRELRIKLRLTCFSQCPLAVATWQTNKAAMGLYNQSWEFQGQNSHILFFGIPRIFLRIPKSRLKGSFQIDSEFGSGGKPHFYESGVSCKISTLLADVKLETKTLEAILIWKFAVRCRLAKDKVIWPETNVVCSQWTLENLELKKES